ncbi:MAG TPA: heavy metal translocating P-type ATPase [Gemmatimonadales bacterium]|nr:heavy metal translocating P-type ATPase [Gemmatimonadales bacterium]
MTATRRGAAILPIAALGFILAGVIARLMGWPWSDRIWLTGLVLTGWPILRNTVLSIVARRFAADIVASLAIIASVALAQPLPGLIVVLMQAGGEALERRAEGRASTAVRELEAMSPTVAHRQVNERIEDIPVDRIGIGDSLLVRPGELVPCDAIVLQGTSSIDASRLTGEPLPFDARPGCRLMSGSINGASPLTVRATALARESQYARIVDLVRTAQASKSPYQRMADQYAAWFTPLTLVVCGLSLALSGDWSRVLAVLVVATPCPLILATPIAIIGGLNLAARHQIIFRHGAAVEQLGQVTAAVLDKTGTLTIGRPRVSRVLALGSFSETEVLRFACGVETVSSHQLARTLVEEAVARGIAPLRGEHMEESPGEGIHGEVAGRQVTVGGRGYVTGRHPSARAAFENLGLNGHGLRAWIVIGDQAAGVVEYADAARPEIRSFVSRLRQLGMRRILLLSGDADDNVEAIARSSGIDESEGNLLPGEKVDRVQALMDQGEKVVMLGDGTNDAPALSTADVGVALASGGGGITAEAADVVLLGDDPAQLVQAIRISRRTLGIARQSLQLGMALSAAAMAFAAAGSIPPTIGALLQEVIDVAVILNALRTSSATGISGALS